MSNNDQGRVEALWLRPGARVPVRSVATVRAEAGVGLEGDHAQGGDRQITLLSQERWQAACDELGAAVPPASRRANVLVSGIKLDVRREGVLRLGSLRIEVRGETRPCELLETEQTVGLNRVLRDDTRGGVYGRILDGGLLAVGDSVSWEGSPSTNS